ncbi:MAG: GNAT family N-acetyltransferase [Actinobacteria bacterium 13_2_20CM_2_71_6]|nr:MAG: GNAT family N-acetyltransferase [Actinobacteria bacterium 13_2_20CM_2_71_6]
MDPLPYETVRGDGVVLRPPRTDDADDIAAGCADPLTQRYVPIMPDPYTRADAIAWIAQAGQATDRRDLVIADPATDRVIGGCGLHHVSHADLAAEVGYWVAPWARRRGVGTRATVALTDWGFHQGFGRIELMTRPDNMPSQRVAIAAGYRREGRRRAAAVDRDGMRYDLIAWARLATDPPGPTPRALPDFPGGRLSDGVVELRPLGPDDIADLTVLRRLPEVAATTVKPEPGNPAFFARLCAEAPGQWLAGEAVRVTIWDAATGAFAGEIGMFQFEPGTGQAMIGYDLLPAWRGRGFATRAVRLLAGWAFHHAGLARLIAGTAPENVASQRVLERAGFQREGYQRSRLPGPAGTRIDDIAYALLPGELAG